MTAKEYLTQCKDLETERCHFYNRLDKVMMDRNIHFDENIEENCESIWDEFYSYIMETNPDDNYRNTQEKYISDFLEKNAASISRVYNKNFLSILSIKNICGEDNEKTIRKLDKMHDNIIKNTCISLGYTYAQLGERIGYSESALRKAVTTNNISEPLQKAIALYLRTIELENQVQEYQDFKNFLKKAIK